MRFDGAEFNDDVNVRFLDLAEYSPGVSKRICNESGRRFSPNTSSTGMRPSRSFDIVVKKESDLGNEAAGDLSLIGHD